MSLTGNMFALAALLHDIGKLRQRTGLEYKETGLEDLYCPYRSGGTASPTGMSCIRFAFIDDVKDRNRELYMRFSMMNSPTWLQSTINLMMKPYAKAYTESRQDFFSC